MFQRRNHNFIAILCIAGANLRPRDDVGIFYRWISKISMHFRCVPCSAAKLHSPRTLKHIKVRSAQTCKWAFVCIAIGLVESKIIIIVFSPALCIRKFEREIVRGWCMCVTCVHIFALYGIDGVSADWCMWLNTLRLADSRNAANTSSRQIKMKWNHSVCGGNQVKRNVSSRKRCQMRVSSVSTVFHVSNKH